MDTNTRRAAVLAASKVTRSSVGPKRLGSALLRSSLALGMTGSLIGCYASHAASGRPVAPPPPAVVLSDAGPLPPDVSPAVADAPTDCASLLASLELTVDERGYTAQFTSEAVRNDPAVGACCLQWDEDLEAGRREREGWPPSHLAYACCDVEVFVQHLAPSSSLGCTPWGPPCPPTMPVAAIA